VIQSTLSFNRPYLSELGLYSIFEMPSFKLSAAVLATTLLSIPAQAQYNINPDSVPLATRQSWCVSQVDSCPLLCDQLPGSAAATKSNTCDPDTLAYTCICGNGQSPNASQYSQTIPYFECVEYGSQCVTACNGDSACGYACRADNLCGAQNPTRVNTTTSSAMPSTTAGDSPTGGVVYTGLGGGAVATGSPGSKSGSQAVLDLGRSYGLLAVFTCLFAGFALVM